MRRSIVIKGDNTAQMLTYVVFFQKFASTIQHSALDNFHWSCLNSRIGNMPNGTPAGAYKCPNCLDNIFPAQNETSPIIDQLMKKLNSVNWARSALGMAPVS